MAQVPLRNKTYLELDSELKTFFQGKEIRDSCNLLRDQVLSSSNLEADFLVPNGVQFTAKKFPEKVLLGLLQYYVAEELRPLINLWLEDHWGAEALEMKAMLLSSKETALGAILVQDFWSARDFYGNVLKISNMKFLQTSFVRKRSTLRPKKAAYRRGYRDHGSMRLPHESEPSYPEEKLLSVEELEERRIHQRLVILAFEQVVLWRLKQEGVVPN